MLAKQKKMYRDNPHAVTTTDAHAECIARDDQPLAVVGDLELRFLAMPYHRHRPIEAAGRQETKRIRNLLRGSTTFNSNSSNGPFILSNYAISVMGG